MDNLISTRLLFLTTMFHTNKFIVLSFVVAALLSETSYKVDADRCRSNSDCGVGEYCCKKGSINQPSECQTNCTGEPCSKDSDCGSARECCNPNKRCDFYKECFSRYDCLPGLFCCRKRYPSERNECKSNCIGETCASDSDCGGPGECCNSSNRCTTACGHTNQCSSNSDCSFGRYCCRRRYWYETRRCKYSCIHETCASDSDCGGPRECCSSSKRCTTTCGHTNRCSSNSDCSFGKYCCLKRFFYGRRECKSDCIGESCSTQSDCGGPRECCSSSKRCTTACGQTSGCSSDSDCSFGKYCCKKRFSYERKECKSDCIGESCSTPSDCGGPRECCSSSKRCTTACGQPNRCSSNSDCSFGKYCCRKRYWFETRKCKSSCVGDTCATNIDCPPSGECCSSKKKCSTDCGKSMTNQIIAIIVTSVLACITVPVVIAICCGCKKNRPTRRLTSGVVHSQTRNSPGEPTASVLQNIPIHRDPAQLQSLSPAYPDENPPPYHSNSWFPAYINDNPPPYHSNPCCPVLPGENPPSYQSNPQVHVYPSDNPPAYQANLPAPYPDDAPPPYQSDPPQQ